MNETYLKQKFEDFTKRYPKLNEEEIYQLIRYENSFQRLSKLSKFKYNSHKADAFYLIDNLRKRRKHKRLTAIFMFKLINSILNKNVEGFFMVYKKMKFFEDKELQRKVLKGPFRVMGRFWGNKVYQCLDKLRVFKNIVNNYEFHIQPFQKRSIKNNIIGLLRGMQLNNHKNQRIMMKNPYSLKNNLFCLISSNLIQGKNEGFIEEFFRLLKGKNRQLNDVEKKLKRFDFLMRGMIRNRYALFFRDFVIHDKSVIDENKSYLSKISKFSNNKVPHKKIIQRHNTQSNLPRVSPLFRHGSLDGNSPEFAGALSFEKNNKLTKNNGFTDSQKYSRYGNEDSNRVITSFLQNDANSPFGNNILKRSFDPNFLSNSQRFNQYSNLKDIPKSLWKKDPKFYLPLLLHSLITKRKKETFEYIKFLNLIKTFSKNKKNNDMTKSFINLKTKLQKEPNLPIKLLAILLEKIISHKIYVTKASIMKRLKNKEIKVFKVLFGKVTPVKPNNTSFIGDSGSYIDENFKRKSMINSQSYINFPKGSHYEQNSNCKCFFMIN